MCILWSSVLRVFTQQYAKWFHSSVQDVTLEGMSPGWTGKTRRLIQAEHPRESALGEWARRGAGDVTSRKGTVDHRGVQGTEAPMRRPSQSCLSERGGAVGTRQGASSEPARDFILISSKIEKDSNEIMVSDSKISIKIFCCCCYVFFSLAWS